METVGRRVWHAAHEGTDARLLGSCTRSAGRSTNSVAPRGASAVAKRPRPPPEASPLARAATPAPAASHRRVNASGAEVDVPPIVRRRRHGRAGERVGKQPGGAGGVRWWGAGPVSNALSLERRGTSSSLKSRRSRRARHCHRASSTAHAPSRGPSASRLPDLRSLTARVRQAPGCSLGVALRVFAVRLASTRPTGDMYDKYWNKGNKRISEAFLGATAKER